MDSTNGGGDPSGFEAHGRTAEFQTVLAIAEALREEFGVSIDAHPGGEGNEAGAINRAFRATARVILGAIVLSGDDPAAVLRWALQRAAVRRLAELGVEDGLAEGLLDSEPGLGDRWLACLVLAPTSVVEELIRDGTVE